MSSTSDSTSAKDTIPQEEKLHIMAVFDEDVAPRLARMGARIGNISCEFAGPQYRHWVIEFRTAISGFEIVSFEYDPEARGIDLADLPMINKI